MLPHKINFVEGICWSYPCLQFFRWEGGGARLNRISTEIHILIKSVQRYFKERKDVKEVIHLSIYEWFFYNRTFATIWVTEQCYLIKKSFEGIQLVSFSLDGIAIPIPKYNILEMEYVSKYQNQSM